MDTEQAIQNLNATNFNDDKILSEPPNRKKWANHAMTTRFSLNSQKFGMMYMELHDERGGYNIQQHPPPSVHVDTERATHKLNVAMMIKFSQNLQPTRNGLSMQ